MRRTFPASIAFVNPLQADDRSWKTDLGTGGLHVICDRLNLPEGDVEREELRRLVGNWQASGPDIGLMCHDNPGLREKLRDCMRLSYEPNFGPIASLAVLPSLAPEGKRSAGTQSYSQEDAAKLRAFSSFWLLTLNPLWARLAGPCARCGNYFLRKRSTQRVYCSRRCGNASTAVARTRARLEIEHLEKTQRAKAAICAWNALETREEHDWLVWLGKREPGLTGKFITRHVNAGKLPEPKRGKSL